MQQQMFRQKGLFEIEGQKYFNFSNGKIDSDKWSKNFPPPAIFMMVQASKHIFSLFHNHLQEQDGKKRTSFFVDFK